MRKFFCWKISPKLEYAPKVPKLQFMPKLQYLPNLPKVPKLQDMPLVPKLQFLSTLQHAFTNNAIIANCATNTKITIFAKT